MSVKPIRFSTDEVRATLDGRKTTKRLVVKDIPLDAKRSCVCDDCVTFRWRSKAKNVDVVFDKEKDVNFPYHPGDVLWVRETWAHVKFGRGEWHYEYRANCEHPKKWSDGSFAEWDPSIHMPREAARIWLRVTDVRVERLQEITMRDIRREGSVPSCAMCSFNEVKSVHGIKCRKAIERSADCALENQFPDCGFRGFWDSTIKRADLDRYGWDANPWVWVVSFERCEKPEEA